MEKKLQRDVNSRMVAGVAAGLAEYFDIDPSWVRVGFVLATLGGGGLLAYIILWIVMPKKRLSFYDSSTVDYTPPGPPLYERPKYGPGHPEFVAKENRSKLIAGMILVVIGMCFLIRQFGLLPYWFSFHKLWPLALIIPGILILSRTVSSDNRPKFTPPADAKPDAKPDPFEEPSEPTSTNTTTENL